MKKYIFRYGILAVLSLTAVTSCSEDFIESEFFQSVPQAPLNTIEELETFVKGQYVSMRSASYYGCDFLMIGEVRSNGMYSDFANGAGYYQTVASYSMIASDQYAGNPYMQMYQTIAKANIVINNIPSKALTWKSSQDPVAIKVKSDYLKGQSYAARALALFDALRMFGQEYSGGTTGVVIPTVYNPTALLGRSSIEETRTQIESDFSQAITLMGNPAASVYGNKTELNPLSVKALMSRYYLYKKDYAKVRSLVADVVAGSVGRYSVVTAADYASSFTKDNSAPNSMFEIAIGTPGDLGVTSIANKLNLPTSPSGGYGNMKVLPSLRNSFGADDIRKVGITSANVLNGKYVTSRDNIRIVRFEEVLLNGAEAELNGGSTDKAISYFNLIQTKRGVATGALPSVTTLSLNEVYNERQKELVGEGFGYWDLLRRGQSITQRSSTGANGVIRNIGDNLLAFPIPRAEINTPGSKVIPNPGYAN